MPTTNASAQKKSKKNRDVTRAGKPILVGPLFRGSHVVPDCVKFREAVLFKDKFGTFGKNGVDGKGAGGGWDYTKKHKPLDKVWVFAGHHRVTPIKQRKFSALEKARRKHSLVSALTSDHYVERELHTFALTSEVRKKNGSQVATERLDLAFETMDDAVKWRENIAQQIASIQRPDRSSRDAWDSAYAASGGSATLQRQGSRSGTATVDSLAQLDDGASECSTDQMATPLGSPRLPAYQECEEAPSNATSDDEPLSLQSLAARTSSLELLQRELGTEARLSSNMDDWKVVSYESNITVLRGAGDHNSDSIMLSYIIRASPRLSVKTLLNRVEQRIQVGSLTVKLKVVETVDTFNDVLETVWYPHGLEQLFMAPRIFRVRRLWRREDDGTYVVIFRAVDPPNQPDSPSWWDWFAPVPCQLIDTCYTFSPLTSEYSRGGDSEETLVTHVSCYGDLGGWLSRRHPWRRLLSFLAPIASDSLNSFLCPLIESSIAIRNKAESERFCTRTFLQSHSEGAFGELSNAGVAPAEESVKVDYITPPLSSFARAESGALPGTEEPSGMSSRKDSALDAPPPAANGVAEGHDSRPNGHSRVGLDVTPADVATCDPKYWTCPGANNLKVRGPTYLKHKKKVPAAEPEFVLAAADLLQVEKPTQHIARFLPSLKASTAPFTFIMQIMFGSPSLSLTFSWAAPHEDLLTEGSTLSGQGLTSPSGSLMEEDMVDESELLHKPFQLVLARFLAGGTNDEEANQRRHGTLKLIPRISQGPWFVKQAVGTTPCLLGRKLAAYYHRGPGYFEVDLDVNSSSVAANIVGLVQGMTKSLCVDMAIVLEGHAVEELPESLLGTVRCSYLDLGSAKLLNTETGEITEKPSR